MGSTCVYTESILHNCGFHTGLFTSPHLIDVRERFRLNGTDISKEKFLEYFWWCFDRLKKGVPAFTVSQPEEAMQVLKQKASELDVHLQVANRLETKLLKGLNLGLAGDHQYINAGQEAQLRSGKASI